ncbi:MAG: L,D-transpeptidase, partial [Parafilimonas terrae]|nr:L,D-transpeptidase [Parafilimonas terrae]
MRDMIRLSLWSALAVTAASGSAQAQQARYAEGGYGGGLIEYLVTGNAGTGGRGWPQRSAAPQAYGAPSRYATPQQMESRVRVAAYSGELLPVEPEPAPVAATPQAYGAPPASAYGAPQADPYRIARAVAPEFQRQEVAFPGPQKPGTIVIDTAGKH